MTSAQPYAEVIGDPIAHSKSPLIHGFWLDKLGIDARYDATRVTAAELPGFLEQRRADPAWRGCNVTMPLKIAAAALLDEHRSPDRVNEPVNLLIKEKGRLIGTNTDVHGVLEPLRMAARPLPGSSWPASDAPRSAVVLGSGGVLLSVTRVLKSLGYRPVTVVARSEEKLRELLDQEGGQLRFVPWGAPLPACDLLVNATPLGMAGQGPLSYDAASVRPDGLVFEMSYDPLVTSLVADARARGLRWIDGLQMLVAQAAPSFERLFGQPAPREHDAELRELLLR